MIAGQKHSNRTVQTKQYPNGQLAIFMRDDDGAPLAELSLTHEAVELAPDEFILKDYSENLELAQELLELELIVSTDRYVLIGTHLCPICKVIF